MVKLCCAFNVQNVQMETTRDFKSQVYGNTPDIVNNSCRRVFVLDVIFTSDHSLVEAFLTEPLDNVI